MEPCSDLEHVLRLSHLEAHIIKAVFIRTFPSINVLPIKVPSILQGGRGITLPILEQLYYSLC